MRVLTQNRRFVLLFSISGFLQFGLVVLCAHMPEMGDLQMFKLWSHQAYDLGIHQAFVHPEFLYDWFPLYLYWSKVVGAVYVWSGMQDVFGPWSRALSVLLKCSMVMLHLMTTVLIYVLSKHIGDSKQAQWASMAWLWNPGIVLATSILGYQDAFHTFIIVLAVVVLCKYNKAWVFVFFALIGLTKPQAAIYLLVFLIFGLVTYGKRWFLHGVLWGFLTCAVALLPFVIYGNLQSVLDMYLGVATVHEWLTGCAHNLWWLISPVPPFASDRVALIWGLNGLQIGLFLFGVICVMVTGIFYKQVNAENLIGACVVLGFGFFMVVTEIHENHHYAAFAFLALLTAMFRRLRGVYYLLSLALFVNLLITYFWLLSRDEIFFGGVRVATLNAGVNFLVYVLLAFWWGQRAYSKNRAVVL